MSCVPTRKETWALITEGRAEPVAQPTTAERSGEAAPIVRGSGRRESSSERDARKKKKDSGSALEEGEFESWCMKLSLGELLEIISRRGLERKLLKEVLTDTARLHPDVRTFLEELVREHPGEDLRILAARRRKEHSEEERERLSRAMRGVLP